MSHICHIWMKITVLAIIQFSRFTCRSENVLLLTKWLTNYPEQVNKLTIGQLKWNSTRNCNITVFKRSHSLLLHSQHVHLLICFSFSQFATTFLKFLLSRLHIWRIILTNTNFSSRWLPIYAFPALLISDLVIASSLFYILPWGMTNSYQFVIVLRKVGTNL